MAEETEGKSARDIAREIFTDVPHDHDGDRFISYVIWNFTGYPHFWKTDDIEAEFRQQLQDYKDDPAGMEQRAEEAFQELSEGREDENQ